MMTTINSFHIETTKLQRVIGYLLAKEAVRRRRFTRKTGYRASGDGQSSVKDIRRWLMNIYAPHGCDISHWSAVNTFFDEKGRVIRKALKFWEDAGKVTSERHGRWGNGYRWHLNAARNELERRKRKRLEREAKWAKRDAKTEVKRAEVQAIADRLADAFALPSGSFKASSTSLTITREQAESILNGMLL
jgi:hypothetical protein